MDHPVTKNIISALIYWFFPITLGAAQGIYSIYFAGLPVEIALLDGFIFCFVFGILGVAVWYVVRYNDPEQGGMITIFMTHLVTAFVFVSLWMSLSKIVVMFFVNSPTYEQFLRNGLIQRATGGAILYALLVSIYYLNLYRQSNREKELRADELKNQMRSAQLNALKSQINPHFLFNSLNSIASLTLSNPEKAHAMVIALSDFMRYSLRKTQNDTVTLETELRNIELYLQIEKIRFGDRLVYHFDIEQMCYKLPIPNLILQPIMENAIKFGVYEASEPVEIQMEVKKSDLGMVVIVRNDFDPESMPPCGEGVGLMNVKDRLRLLYGSNSLLSVSRNASRFIVTLTIPDQGIA